MEDWGFAGICGTLWPGWWRGPWPGPGPQPWLRLVAGIIGGIAAVALLGDALAPDRNVLALGLIAIAGGNFLALVVDLATSGLNKGNVTPNV